MATSGHRFCFNLPTLWSSFIVVTLAMKERLFAFCAWITHEVSDVIVLTAYATLSPIRIPARVHCSYARMKQIVIGRVRANNKVFWFVVCLVFIRMMNYGSSGKWFAKHLLCHNNMLKFNNVVASFSNSHFVAATDAPVTIFSAQQNVRIAMFSIAHVVLEAPLTSLCCIGAAFYRTWRRLAGSHATSKRSNGEDRIGAANAVSCPTSLYVARVAYNTPGR
jgi:hypothetical protein